MNTTLANFTDVLVDEICNSQPLSLSSSFESRPSTVNYPCNDDARVIERPPKGTGQRGQFRCTEEIDPKYRDVFTYPYFNLVQSRVIEDALYSDKSIVVCAPTGSGKTVVFEMAIVQLLMELEEKQYTEDFKIIYMAPVKALCTERLTEWYSKFTRLGLLCIEVTGDTDVDFTQLKPYKIIITTPEKWDMLTRRWRDHRGLVEVIKLFLIDEVHILNDETRGPVLEAVVSRMKTIENSAQSVHRIEQLQMEIQGQTVSNKSAPRIRFVAVSATVSNPEDVATWLGTSDKPAVFYKFGDECRPVKLKRIVEGYPCAEGTSIFKFDIILNYKLWPIIQKYHSGKPTLIFCNTRKSVVLTAETLSRELTISFNAEQKAKLTALAASIKNKKLQALVMSGVGCHHAGLLYEERQSIEFAFRNRDLPILITTTTLAMGVNLPAHLVIVKNTQQYVNGAYQEYSISTVLQMVGRAGRPQFDTEATAVIMTRLVDKPRYQALVGGCEPLQSFLHKRLPENLNSEAALGTVGDVAQCVQWLRSTFLYVRAARDPKKYLNLPQNSPQHLISKKIEELCVKAMNGLASSGLITMDEASCIASTEAGRLMSIFYLDLETMKQIMKIEGTESLERLLALICESHELADMHLRVDERRCLNLLNRNNAAATIRFPMKGKISTRQMKLNCVIQAVLGCLSIPDPSLNQEAMKIMRIADRVCKCLVTYVTRPDLISQQPQFFSAVLNSIILAKCVAAHLWENSPFVSKQLKGIGPTFSTLLASAGKVNFMLLEESHPRDLERIMNKGAPAGNVLRKQVSLLPKYQLTMIPVDEKTVTIQLVLLNQSHLAENMDNLTAGDSHKSYIIVGDSNNNLLLLAAFKDTDLISVFDGTITHQVRRKHNFEHKIFAHCVSSRFVGIDVQSQYVFNDLEPFIRGTAATTPHHALTNAIPTKKPSERQTCITDTFKERKRKIHPDAIEKSKEKIKRENAIIENFKHLKQTFETASKNVNQSMNKQTRQKEETLNKIAEASLLSNNTLNNTIYAVNGNSVPDNSKLDQNTCFEEMDSDEFIDEKKIDSILNEIENEMGKNKTNIDKAKPLNNNPYFREKNLKLPNPFATKFTPDCLQNSTTKSSSYKTLSAPRKPKPKNLKSNYTFIELLERKLSLSDDEEKAEEPQKDNGFLDTIKSQIQKYLTKTHIKTAVPDTNLKVLLEKPEDRLTSDDEKTQEVKTINLDSEILNSPIRSPYPRYEIKEILGGKNSTQQNITKLPKMDEENLTYNKYVKDCDMDETSSHWVTDLKASTPLHNTDTKLIDEGDDKNNSGNVKEDDLDDTLILNFDETSEILAGIKENVNREFDNCYQNNIDDIICVEDYYIKNDNNKFCDNAGSLDPDVIMISPTEIRDQFNNKKEVKDQHSDTNENNFATEITITEGGKNNPSYFVLDDKEFQNLYNTTHKDIPAKNPCLDMVLKSRNQLVSKDDTPSYSEALSKEDNYRNLYEFSKTNSSDKNPCSNIVRKDRNQLVTYNRLSNYKTNAMEDIDHDALAKNPCSDIVLNDRNRVFGFKTSSHDKTLAIEDNNMNSHYESNMVDSLAKITGSDVALRNRNELVKNNRISHDKALAIQKNNIGHNLYHSTLDSAFTKTPGSDVAQQNRNQLLFNKVSDDETLAIEDNNIGHSHNDSSVIDGSSKNPSSDLDLKDRNQIFEYKRASHDKTLPIEYTDSTVSNQAQGNKSCPSVSRGLQPSYDLINKSHNKFSNSSTNLDDNKQKTDYVKRYTYSASKVDVCTKQTPDYCVQVIKKVKMDLDITAIVSRKHNSSQNYKTDFEEPSTNKRMKMIEHKTQESSFQNANEDANKRNSSISSEGENISIVNFNIEDVNKRDASINNEVDNISIVNFTIEDLNKRNASNNKEVENISKINLPPAQLSRPEVPRVKTVFKPPYKAKGDEESENNNVKNINTSEEYKISDSMANENRLNKYDIRQQQLEIQENVNDKDEIISEKLRESETGNNTATGDNKIRDLLQKYSKILTKNTVKTGAPSCSGIHRTTVRGSTTTKSQKPFKITDIHKLHATLPETIVDNKPDIENNTPQFPTINRYVEAKNRREDANSSQYTRCSQMRPVEEIPEYESINDLELEPIHLPDNVDLEPSTDYKIDQSMFDPKTLLQSVAADESDEIVPPPPEFCDGISNYSPGYDNAEASMADYSVTQRAPYSDSFPENDNNMQYNESIFHDSCASDLTPSTEIETWNLSQDGWEPRNTMSLSPAQSFTVMRKNTNNDYNNFMQHGVMSMQGRLGQYRFNQKSKLKIRK